MHRGCFVWTPTPPLAGWRTPRPGPVRVCVCLLILARSGGLASRARSGAPHLLLWPLCLSALLGPLWVGVAPVLLLCLPSPPPFCFCLFFSFFSLRLLCLLLSLVSGPGCPGPWRFVLFVLLLVSWLSVRSCFLCVAWRLAALRWLPPPPLSLAVVAVPRCLALVFFFFSSFFFSFFFGPLFAPPLSQAFCVFRARVPWALALVCGCRAGLSAHCVFFPSRLSVLCALSRVLCPPVGRWLFPVGCAPPPPPPLLCLVVSPRSRSVPWFFFLLFCAPPLSPAFSGFRPRVPWALALCFVCFSRPPAARLSVRSCRICVSCLAVGCFLVVAPPPPLPFCVSPFSSLLLGALVFFLLLLWAPVVSGFLWCPAPAALGLVRCLLFWPSASRLSVRSGLFRAFRLAVGCSLVVAAPPPPSPFVSRGFRRSCSLPWFFFLLPLCALVVSGFLWFPAPGALGLGAVRCLLFWPSASRLPVRSRLFRAFDVALGCSLVVAAPAPPPFVSRGFRHCRSVLCAVCCAVLCVPGCGAAPRCCALCRPVLCCRVLCCFVALVWCPCLLHRALWRCPSPWGPVLCSAVFCGVPPRCVLCAVCVLSWRGGACCCSPLCFVLCVSQGAVLCVPCPLRSLRCCALLCWCACVVLFVWCVLLLAPGAVVRCCVLCCFLWCAVVRCWVCAIGLAFPLWVTPHGIGPKTDPSPPHTQHTLGVGCSRS